MDDCELRLQDYLNLNSRQQNVPKTNINWFMTVNAKRQMVRSNLYNDLPRITLAIRQTAVSLKQVRLVLFGRKTLSLRM